MDKCRILKELSSYLDNQLSDRRKIKVEKHLEACEDCAKELMRLKFLSQKIKAWQAPALSPDFDASLRNKIVQEELERGAVKMNKKTLRILIPSGVLAGILVLVLFGAMKRGIQGKIKESSSEIGEQYRVGSSASRYSTVSYGSTADKKAYEPYYASSSFDVARGSTDTESPGAGGGALRYQGKDMASRTGSVSFAQMDRQKLDNGTITSPEELKEFVNSAVALTKRSVEMRAQELLSGEGSIIVIQPVLPATGEGEKIIRTAGIRLEVEDGQIAYKKAAAICQELDGYLAASNFYKDNEGRESGTIIMRIPKDNFLSALDKLGGLGKVENSATNSQDVGPEYANLKTELDTAMIVYDKMLEALKKRQVTVSEAMRLESELTPIRKRIDDLKNQIEYLNNAVSFTTVTVNFHEPDVSLKVLKESQNAIKEGLIIAKINAVKSLAGAIKNLPGIFVLGVLFISVLGVVILIRNWIIGLRKRE